MAKPYDFKFPELKKYSRTVLYLLKLDCVFRLKGIDNVKHPGIVIYYAQKLKIIEALLN